MATEGMTISNETRLLHGAEPMSCWLFHHRKNSTGKDDLIPRAGCKFCAAKAAALNRITAAGGDSAKALEDSTARAGAADVLVIEMVPVGRLVPLPSSSGNTIVETAEPAGVVKKTTKRVPQAYIDGLLVDPQLTPLRAVSEDYFQENPELRENSIAGATTVLMGIERDEIILAQFFKKGFAVMELVEVD